MIKKFLKFIQKSPYRNILLKIAKDIQSNNLWWYDLKPMVWMKSTYRIRKWDVRIIFKKEGENIIILKVDNRWDVYK